MYQISSKSCKKYVFSSVLGSLSSVKNGSWSHARPICTQNFIKIGPAVSEEFRYKHRDRIILYSGLNKIRMEANYKKYVLKYKNNYIYSP